MWQHVVDALSTDYIDIDVSSFSLCFTGVARRDFRKSYFVQLYSYPHYISFEW